MKLRTALFAVALMAALSFTCFADTTFAPYNSYIYNEEKTAVSTPNSFLPEGYLTGEDWGVGAMNAPEDMMTADDGRMIIADTGNNRIIIVDKGLSEARAISEFTFRGEQLTLDRPVGVFESDDGTLYICDTGNQRVLVTDVKGEVRLIVTKPTEKEFEQEIDFEPRKIAVDKAGNMYVLCANVYQGAVVFTPDGGFDGFYGSNAVQSTLEIVVQKMFKGFMTKEQKRKMAKYVPAEYENLTVSGNFIYTVSYQTNTGGVNLNTAIRKLNLAGNNITDSSAAFGDLDMYYDRTLKGTVYTRFCDLCVDSDAYIFALDSTYGKIFIYDPVYELINIFGGLGEQTGLFRYPVAIGTVGDNIVVLDRGKASVTVFSPTGFFGKVRAANALFEKGLYEEALTPWREVLDECSGYTLANAGLGKALFQQGDYSGAMTYFKRAGDRSDYSEAFKYYRLNLIRDNFSWFMAGLFGLIALIVVWRQLLKRPVGTAASAFAGRIPAGAKEKLGCPGHCMFHPFSGFEEMRDTGRSSYIMSLVIVALWVLSQLVYRRAASFIFRPGAGSEADFNLVFASTAVLWALYVIANLGLRTFMAGRGSFRDICSASAYSLIPYIAATVVSVPVSYLLTENESMLLTFIYAIGLIWSGVMLVAGIKGIHEYTFGETVKAILLTALGVVLIVFLFVLFYSSLQQTFSLLGTIFSELRYRYF